MAKKNKESKGGHGCFTVIVLPIIIAFAFACLITRATQNKPITTPPIWSTSNPTSTPRTTQAPTPTNTPKPTKTPKPTRTPRPTKTPEPTPTATPDFASMEPVAAAEQLAVYFCDGMTVRSVKQTTDYITVDIFTESYASARSFVRDCCSTTLHVAEHVFASYGFDRLVMKFATNGRDKYGNPAEVTVVTITLYRDTAQKINYSYMLDNLYITTERFLQITDSYFIHPDVTNGVY